MVLKKLLAGIAVAFTLTAGAAGAATFSIEDGTAGFIPGGTAKNDALIPLFGPGTKKLGGYFNSVVKLIGPGEVTFSFHGREAAWGNKFVAGSDEFKTSSVMNNTWSVPGFASFLKILDAGVMDFAFTTTGGHGTPPIPPTTVQNGSNNASDVTFFASMVGGGTKGTSLYLFFDDGGAGPNDNHDDMVVRMDVAPIPLPAAGFMLLAGLGGLFAAKRRRNAA